MKPLIRAAASFLIVAALAVFIAGCDEPPNYVTPDQQQAAQQKKVSAESNAQTGMPGVTNFTEKKLVKHLYELRDEKIVTYSYVPDMQGHLWHLCNSIGYGLPYGVQFTNPERPAEAYETHEQGNLALPQAEPNGLYMPPTAEGTWIICTNPNGSGDLAPVYVEPRVIVSPFKLTSFGEYGEATK
jgi:hypothetical protein